MTMVAPSGEISALSAKLFNLPDAFHPHLPVSEAKDFFVFFSLT
jgi:hypothetical protein